MGRQVGRAALNALPGIGGIVGGALSTPETMGTGTIAGVALGAGAGRGMRDILTEYFGLEPPSTATSKGTRIALDVGETAALSAIIPGLIEAAKTPGQTVKSLMELLPAKLRPAIPPSMERAPARILTRPAWQTWEQNAPQAAPAPNTQATGTSMQPAAQPVMTPRPAPVVPPRPPQQTGTSMAPAPMPPPVARPAAPEPVPGPSEAPPTPTDAPKPAGPPSQKQLNEEAIARRRAAYQESLKAQPEAAAPADPAAALKASSSFANLPTDAERAFPPNKSGLPFNAPRVVKARGKIADLADMPPSDPSKTIAVGDVASELGAPSDTTAAYQGVSGRIMLDRKAIAAMSPAERATVVRHELAHKIETESDLWKESDTALWKLWETDRRNPIWDFMEARTGRTKFGNDVAPEIMAELYASEYPKGTFTVKDRPIPYEHEAGQSYPREYKIPADLRGVLDQIESKLGIWGKKATRGTIADLADMPPSEPAAAAGPTPADIARVSAATKKKFSGTISDLADVPGDVAKYDAQQMKVNPQPSRATAPTEAAAREALGTIRSAGFDLESYDEQDRAWILDHSGVSDRTRSRGGSELGRRSAAVTKALAIFNALPLDIATRLINE